MGDGKHTPDFVMVTDRAQAMATHKRLVLNVDTRLSTPTMRWIARMIPVRGDDMTNRATDLYSAEYDSDNLSTLQSASRIMERQPLVYRDTGAGGAGALHRQRRGAFQ